MPSPQKRFLVNALWLLKLRWVAVVGQLATIAAVIYLFDVIIENAWALGVVIGVTALSNLILQAWYNRWSSDPERRDLPWDLILGLVMVMDMLSLTALLFATGGPTNPFFLFFFVNLCLAALVLKPNGAWILNLLSVGCFAFLVYDHHEIDELHLGASMLPVMQRGWWSLSQLGLIAAFTTCSSVIVYFMTRLTAELRAQQLETERAQAHQARSEKLEALGTLAAGAAHELATPLSTIAVVAKDLEKSLDDQAPDLIGAEDIVEDVRLLSSQLTRCRTILDRMASQSGQAIGESILPITVQDLAEAVVDELPENRVLVDLPPEFADEAVTVPKVGLSQAIRGLIQNAIDADQSGRPVYLKIRRSEDHWEWEIRDRGPGMSVDVLSRVSEPFFTTKKAGKGMGLGVFLAKNVIQRLGGLIEFKSQPERGTSVIITLPADKQP